MKLPLTIVAFLAFLNPLCCCSAAWLMAASLEADTPVPGCCQGEEPSDSEKAPGGAEHDPAECPHRANQSFHEEGVLEIGAPVVDRFWVPLLIDILDLPRWKNSLPGEGKLPPDHALARPPRLRTQDYCVYLI